MRSVYCLRVWAGLKLTFEIGNYGLFSQSPASDWPCTDFLRLPLTPKHHHLKIITRLNRPFPSWNDHSVLVIPTILSTKQSPNLLHPLYTLRILRELPLCQSHAYQSIILLSIYRVVNRFQTSTSRRRSTSSLNSAGSGGGGSGSAGGGAVGKDRDATFGGEKWWIGGRRADGSERYYPLAPLRYFSPHLEKQADGIRRYRSTDRISI
jgi:hypothetical protein